MATIDQLSFEDIEKLLDLAKDSELFRRITLAERIELLENATISSPAKGEYLFFADDKPTFFFLLYTGKMLEFSEEKNVRKILRLIKPGCFFGIQGAIDGSRYGTIVKAIEDSRVVSFPREELIKIIDKHPELKEILI